jgi:hypothetical protein
LPIPGSPGPLAAGSNALTGGAGSAIVQGAGFNPLSP